MRNLCPESIPSTVPACKKVDTCKLDHLFKCCSIYHDRMRGLILEEELHNFLKTPYVGERANSSEYPDDAA